MPATIQSLPTLHIDTFAGKLNLESQFGVFDAVYQSTPFTLLKFLTSPDLGDRQIQHLFTFASEALRRPVKCELNWALIFNDAKYKSMAPAAKLGLIEQFSQSLPDQLSSALVVIARHPVCLAAFQQRLDKIVIEPAVSYASQEEATLAKFPITLDGTTLKLRALVTSIAAQVPFDFVARLQWQYDLIVNKAAHDFEVCRPNPSSPLISFSDHDKELKPTSPAPWASPFLWRSTSLRSARILASAMRSSFCHWLADPLQLAFSRQYEIVRLLMTTFIERALNDQALGLMAGTPFALVLPPTHILSCLTQHRRTPAADQGRH